MTEKRFNKLWLALLMGSVALPAVSARIDANEAQQLASEFFESHSGRVPKLELCAR